MTRTLVVDDDSADNLVKSILLDSLDTMNKELSDYNQHPDDEKYCLFTRKAFIRVINYFSSPTEQIEE